MKSEESLSDITTLSLLGRTAHFHRSETVIPAFRANEKREPAYITVVHYFSFHYTQEKYYNESLLGHQERGKAYPNRIADGSFQVVLSVPPDHRSAPKIRTKGL